MGSRSIPVDPDTWLRYSDIIDNGTLTTIFDPLVSGQMKPGQHIYITRIRVAAFDGTTPGSTVWNFTDVNPVTYSTYLVCSTPVAATTPFAPLWDEVVLDPPLRLAGTALLAGSLTPTDSRVVVNVTGFIGP